MFNNLHHIPSKKQSLLTLIFLSFLVIYLDHISMVPPSHPLNCSSLCLSIFFTSIVIVLAMSFCLQFFQSHPCAPSNMMTFHSVNHLDLNIMVNNLGTTFVFEQCLYIMFTFQLGSLHISKDVLYDFNNLVLSLLYQIPTMSSHGR